MRGDGGCHRFDGDIQLNKPETYTQFRLDLVFENLEKALVKAETGGDQAQRDLIRAQGEALLIILELVKKQWRS
jgi:hypothetical protein